MARGRKTTEQRIAEIDLKIEKKKAELGQLELQKQRLLHPITMKTVIAKAKEVGLTAEEIAQKLGLQI